MGPLRRRIWWVGKRLLLLAPVVAWAAVGGPFLAPLMWALSVYVLVRAWPALLEDWRGVRGVLGLGKSGKYAGRRGEF